MNFGPAPSLALASRRGGCGVVEQVGLWVVQTHMSTGPVREGVEVLAGLLAKLESLARTVDKNSEAARDRVDQLDLRQLLEQASVYDDLGVSAAGADYARKAGKAITAHITAGLQVGAGPGSDGLFGKAGLLVGIDPHRMALVVGTDRRNIGRLVGRSAAANALTLTTQVGPTGLDQALQGLIAAARCLDLHQLIVFQLDRAVAVAWLTYEGQGLRFRLVLAGQIDRQQLGCQRQLGAVHYRARSEGVLPPAAPALEELACPVTEHLVRGRRASQTAKTPRPSQRHRRDQKAAPRCLNAVAREEIMRRAARPELDWLHRSHAALRLMGAKRQLN